MDEKVCRDCGTYNESTCICKNGKNPIEPKRGVKIDPECPACSDFTFPEKRGYKKWFAMK